MNYDYNTTRAKLILPEYGRSIQRMVDHLLTIEDRQKRTEQAYAVVGVMANITSQNRDLPDFKRKLWDHLFIMSDFKLEVDSPFPVPSRDKLEERPSRVPYITNHVRYRHYGQLTEGLIRKIAEMEDPELREILILQTANHMKKSYVSWNNDNVEDSQIYHDMKSLYGLDVEMPENSSLTGTVKEVSVMRPGKYKSNNKSKQNKGQKKFYKR